ncbi:MAG: sterol desaturase family protein [Bacteroidia bacterium]|nr:sterol desaturase family protein [Bacteroidia bacterium]
MILNAGITVDLPKLLTYYQGLISGIVFLIIYTAEHVFPQRKELIDIKNDAFNFITGLVGFLIIFSGGYLFNYCINWSTAHHFGILNQFILNKYANVLLQFTLIDLFMYWWHRANHELPLLWYFHKFHHKDEKMTASTALRFHPGELFLSILIKIFVFSLLGIQSWISIGYGIVLFIVITLHHSNLRITDKTDFLLRYFISSPKMHRIHHSIIKLETNSNYGSVFPYWDKVFKTYIKYPEKPVIFGIVEK